MSDTTTFEVGKPQIERSFEDKQRLLAFAGALGQKRSWEGYGANIRNHLSQLEPAEPNERNSNRSFQLDNGLRVGDRKGLAMLAVEGYLYRRVEDGSVTQVTEAADHLNAFGLELTRNFVTTTHQGSTGWLVEAIEILQADEHRFTPEVNNYANQVLHALKARHVENKLRLAAKVGTSLLAGIGLQSIAHKIKR